MQFKHGFPGVYATLKAVEERAALRDIERQAFRDLSAGKLKGEKDFRPTGRLGGETQVREASQIKTGRAAGVSVARAAGKVLHAAADAFSSLFAPEPTPRQKHESAKAAIEREIETEQAIDFTRFTADLARARQQEQDRETARERERGGRER